MKRAEEPNGTTRAVLDHGSVNYTRTRKQLLVYFTAVNRQYIKIGKTRQEVGVRLEQHSMASPSGHRDDMELLCAVRSVSDADETQIHDYFRFLRLPHSKEVFLADQRLVDYVRWLRDESYVMTAEDPEEYRLAVESIPPEESARWMPREDRRKPAPVIPTGPLQQVLFGAEEPPCLLPFGLLPRIVTADDFYTDAGIIEAARLAMGSIDLDPATHAIANTVVKAARVYTQQTNGLLHPWGGNVWLNPPFSAWGEWAPKIQGELDGGGVRQLCLLAATRAQTAKRFIPLMRRCDAVCVFEGRRRFWGARAGEPDEGHVVLYFGARRDDFVRAFKPLGDVKVKP